MLTNNRLKFLTNDNLQEINSSLPWVSTMSLPEKEKRILGVSRPNRSGGNVESYPDYRVTHLHESVNLAGKTVLEFGCLEGGHTVSLLEYTDQVTAVDVRPQNVIKTITKLALFNLLAEVFIFDAETCDVSIGKYDVIFSCGVFYHLTNPIEHMKFLSKICTQAVLLDTHISSTEDEHLVYQNKKYFGKTYLEAGWKDPLSGKNPTSFWLSKNSLKEIITLSGFIISEEFEYRKEPNGDRICWILKKI